MSVREHHPAAEANVVVLHEVVVPHLLDVVAVVITLPGRMSVAIVTMIVVTEIVLAAQMIVTVTSRVSVVTKAMRMEQTAKTGK